MSGPPVGVDARTGASAESADDAARASAEVWRTARRLLDGLPGGPRAQHRARGRRPARAARGRRRGRAALRGPRRERHRGDLRRPGRADQPVRQRARPARGRAGRDGLLAARPRPGDLRDGAGHPQAHQRLLPAVRGVRPGAGPRAAARSATARVLVTTPTLYRRRVAAGPRRAARPRARPARGRRPPPGRRCAGHRRPGHAVLGRAARRRRRRTRSPPPTPRRRRCCTSPAARPASPRARCTCTRPSSPTTPPARTRSGLRPGDVFWCTADPGWVTGTSYGIIAPLTHGVDRGLRRRRVRRPPLVPDPRASTGSPSGTPRRPRCGC